MLRKFDKLIKRVINQHPTFKTDLMAILTKYKCKKKLLTIIT